MNNIDYYLYSYQRYIQRISCNNPYQKILVEITKIILSELKIFPSKYMQKFSLIQAQYGNTVILILIWI